MLRIKIPLIIFLGMVFLSGCSLFPGTPESTAQVLLSTVPQIPATENLPIPIGTVTATITPKSIHPILTVTPTANPTPTSPPSAIQEQCLQILDSLPLDGTPAGNLIIKNYDNKDAFIWNLRTGTHVRFPRGEGDRLHSFDVSPDRTKVVYFHASDGGDRTVIAGPDGKTIWSKAIEWYSWFDNHRLQSSERNAEGWFRNLIFLDPFTGQTQELYPDFPDLYIDPQYPKWNNPGFGVYDPTLTRVVYPECGEVCRQRWDSGGLGWTVALLDLENDQVIVRLVTWDSYGFTPIWTPDGKQFIFATKLDPKDFWPPANRFYAVSRDGEVSQLAYFPGMEIYNSYTLSPDGQKVAFWLGEVGKSHEEPQLMVLDVVSKQITNYCIQNSNPNYYVQLIWSPDSTHLALNLPGVGNPDKNNVVIVDLVQGYAARLIDNVAAEGWMK